MFGKKLVATAALLAFLPLSVAAQTPVKEVNVTTDLTAIQNAEAAAYWTNISADLQAAIAARLVDRIADEGSKISVDVDELSLANSFQNRLGLEDALLVGKVNVSNDKDNSKFDGYELTVSAITAQAFAEDGKPLEGALSDTPAYYKALVSAFADGVVSRLK